MNCFTHQIAISDQLSSATLSAYIPDVIPIVDPNPSRPALIICPGGGYAALSDFEAEPVALRFSSYGVNCFVLHYHTGPQVKYPIPQLELAASIAYVKSTAESTHTDKEKVYVCGFSAGGHLAASIGTRWCEANWAKQLKLDKSLIKPAGMILGYAVISAYQYVQMDTIRNLLKDDFEKYRNEVSLEYQVSEYSVPAFIWVTKEDDLVPYENSLLLDSALRAKGVSTKLLIYPHGPHGLSLADDTTCYQGQKDHIISECQEWPILAAKWMKASCNA